MHKKKRRGYILIYMPGHPHAQKQGYVLEHRLVMEKHLGRYLTKGEDVHHRNKKRDDNRIENLELYSHNEHCRLEATGRKYSEETRHKWSIQRKGRKGYWTGKTLSERHKLNISINSAHVKPSLEYRKETSIRMKGNTYGRANKGRQSPTKGKPKSDETKKRMSEARKKWWSLHTITPE